MNRRIGSLKRKNSLAAAWLDAPRHTITEKGNAAVLAV